MSKNNRQRQAESVSSVPQAWAAQAALSAGDCPPSDEPFTPDTLVGRSQSKSPSLPDASNPRNSKDFHFGGYDGGTAVGFQCKISDDDLSKLIFELEQLKEQAGDAADMQDGIEGFLGGHRVVVFPTGAKEGLYYKFRIQWKGAVILIHHRPPAGRQAVRARYTTVSLTAWGLRGIHADVTGFLMSLGFTETEDTVSRADMQLTCAVPMSFFADKENSGHIVTKFRSTGNWHFKGTGKRKKYTSLTLGTKAKVQLCIYDKREEMCKGGGDQKESLLLDCIGGDWWNSDFPITRIEFRLGRKALKGFGIRSIADLFKRERAVINKLTHDWFRILLNPKKRGMENKATVHSVWEHIRSLFFRYFPGNEVTDVKWHAPEAVAGDSPKLLAQAFGCINKAVALKYGKQVSVRSLGTIICSLFDSVAEKSLQKVNSIVSRIETLSGIPIRGNDNTDYGMANAADFTHAWERFITPPVFRLRN